MSKRGRPPLNRMTVSREGTSEIGFRIQFHRVESRISLKDVAEYLGVSPQYISNVEHGRATLAWDYIAKLSKKLNVEGYYLASANLESTDAHKQYRKTLKSLRVS